MARTKNKIAPETKALDKMQANREMADRLYGDGLPFDLTRVETIGKTHTANWAQEMVEAGRCYLWIKAYVEHGEFLESLKRMGVNHTGSWFAIRAAQLVAEGVNCSALNNLGTTKFKLLSVLEKPVVDEYLKGGNLGEIPHDDVAEMTTRELEDEVRKLREKVKKTEAVVKEKIRQKDEQIAHLELENENRLPPTKEQVAQAALYGLNKEYTIALAEVNSSIRNVLSLIAKAEKIEDVNVQQLNDWMGQFDMEMNTFRGLSECWTDVLDNLGPQKDWRISDL